MLKDDSQHMVRVECPNKKCGHVQHIDKRVVCRPDKQKLVRGMDIIVINCEKCRTRIEVEVKCDGYR